MKPLVAVLLSVMVLVAASTGAVWVGWSRLVSTVEKQWGAGSTQVTQGPPRLSAEKLNEYVSLRTRIGTVVTAENNWYRGIWVIEGDALLGTDCGQAEWSSVDTERRSLLLRLPEPRVILARVNHERTRLHDFRTITWNPVPIFIGNPDDVR